MSLVIALALAVVQPAPEVEVRIDPAGLLKGARSFTFRLYPPWELADEPGMGERSILLKAPKGHVARLTDSAGSEVSIMAVNKNSEFYRGVTERSLPRSLAQYQEFVSMSAHSRSVFFDRIVGGEREAIVALDLTLGRGRPPEDSTSDKTGGMNLWRFTEDGVIVFYGPLRNWPLDDSIDAAVRIVRSVQMIDRYGPAVAEPAEGDESVSR